jgi:two-component system LytT family response regulator
MTKEKKAMKIRTLIADDEPAARDSIQILISKRSDIEIVGICKDGKETAETILDLKPDLVFLDIQMPAMDGFEILEAIKDDLLPVIVFVTAFDQYALKAFEMSAVDYLLKPYSDERFVQSLDKAKQWIASRNAHSQIERIENLLTALQNSSSSYLKKLVVKNQGKITFIPVSTILSIESEGNFVKVHTQEGQKLASYTFKQLEAILDPKVFTRIHKSYMVNLDFIESIEPYFHGDYHLVLTDGSKIKLSRNYKDSLDLILHQS